LKVKDEDGEDDDDAAVADALTAASKMQTGTA